MNKFFSNSRSTLNMKSRGIIKNNGNGLDISKLRNYKLKSKNS